MENRIDANSIFLLTQICRENVINYDLLHHALSLIDVPRVCKRVGLSRQLQAVCKTNANAKCVRLFIDHGYPVDTINAYGETPLFCALYNSAYACAVVLLDAGAKPGMRNVKGTQIPKWAHRFVAARINARAAAIAVLCLTRVGSRVVGNNGRDVLRIIARCVWSTRFDDKYERFAWRIKIKK